MQVIFPAPPAQGQILDFGGAQGNGDIAPGSNIFLKPQGVAGVAERESKQVIITAPGIVDALRTLSVQGPTGTLAFTVRKNLIATALAIPATAGLGATIYQALSDLAHSFPVAAGDILDLNVVSTTVGSGVASASARFTPTV